MKLSEKQKAFADYYIQTCNATEAALKAGYSPKTAYSSGQRNTKNPIIKAFIDERLKQMEEERIADSAEVLKYLTSVMRGEVKEEVVVVEGEGEGYSSAKKMNKEVSPRDRNKAAELLGKRYRLFIDKVEQQVDATVNSTAKLDSILEQLGDEDNE